jgi:transketolase
MKRLGVHLADALADASAGRSDIWVIDGDLGDSYGLFDEECRPRFSQFLQAGIAEQSMVAVAAGLATTGMRPWVFSFSAFLCHRAADQIRTCVAHQQLPVVLVGSHAGAATGPNGSSHASLGDLGVIGSIGGIAQWAPADLLDVRAAVADLLATSHPAYVRLSREPSAPLPLGPGPIRTNGLSGEVVLLSTGLASHWAAEAVSELSLRGHPVPWAHIASLSVSILRSFLELHPRMSVAIVVEDHRVVGGLADALRRLAPPRLFVQGLGWPAGWHGESGSIDELRQAHGLDLAALVRCIEYRQDCGPR